MRYNGTVMPVPWLSVIMPVYNGEDYLPRALESIATQQDRELEVLALDDGSTDRSLEILNSWASRLPLRVERPDRCGNWVAVTNRGLTMARGEYACFLHQDDAWRAGRLDAIRRVIGETPGVDFVVHATQYIDRRGRSLGRSHPLLRESADALPAREVVPRFLIQNVLSIPSALFRRTVALEEGGLDERLWYSADWDLWLRLAGRGRTRSLSRALSQYRLHPQTQTTVRSGDLDDFRRQHELVFEKHFSRWRATLPDAESVAARARLSIDVNTALAAMANRKKAELARLAAGFVRLGPVGAWRYVRDSRIVERMAARLRGRLWWAPRR
jgi:glycosyltransferase involved in cell wall biosynthesis